MWMKDDKLMNQRVKMTKFSDLLYMLFDYLIDSFGWPLLFH